MQNSKVYTTTISEYDDSFIYENASNRKMHDMIFSMLKNKSLQEVIDFGYSILGNPPLIVSDAVLIASPPNCTFANATFLDMIHGTAPGCHEPIYLLTEAEFVEKQQRSENPLLVDCKHLGLRLIVAKITHNDETVAVIQVPESEKEFGKNDILLTHLIAQFISSELSDPLTGSRLSDMLFRAKLLDLLQQNDKQDYHWVHMIQEKESSTLCVAVLKPENHSKYTEEIEERLNSGFYCCKCVRFNNTYVALCTVNGSEQHQEISQYFESYAKELNGVAAISAEFSVPAQILPHYNQALRTIEAGSALMHNQHLYDYSQFSIETILFDSTHYIKTDEYFDSIFNLLAEADRINGTDLYRTLKTFLQYNGDKKTVSTLLGLHRNTLAFRLHCIESIIGWDISEGETLYRLKFLDKLRNNSEFWEKEGKKWNSLMHLPSHIQEAK